MPHYQGTSTTAQNADADPTSVGRLAVFGAGGLTLQLIDLLAAKAEAGASVVIIDDHISGACFDFTIVAATDLLPTDRITIAVSDAATRRIIAERLDLSTFATLVDERAAVSSYATLGRDAIVCAFARIEPGVTIGDHCHFNVASFVAHQCVIGDFVTLAPHACVNGNVRIEDGAYIGAGAVVRQGRPGQPLVIGRDAVIGMGAIVTRDVAAGATIYGNPARAR